MIFEMARENQEGSKHASQYKCKDKIIGALDF